MWQWSTRILTTVFAAFPLAIGSAYAQKLPASTTIGTNPAGTVFYAVSAGLAKVISGAGPMQSVVQPYTGSSTFMPLLDSGEIDFGIINAVEMNLGYQGSAKLKISGKNPLPHVPNIRLIMRGSPLSVSLVVKKDSPIKTVYDVKGKRVTGEYPANIAIWYHIYTQLANAGFTWDDVKVVPVPAVNDGVDALVQARADVSNHAINAAKIKEADAAVGVRFLSTGLLPAGRGARETGGPGILSHHSQGGLFHRNCRRHLRTSLRYLHARAQRAVQRSCHSFAKGDLGQYRQATAVKSAVPGVDPRARRIG
jgi:TRAP transporter TAXI family solute receptor